MALLARLTAALPRVVFSAFALRPAAVHCMPSLQVFNTIRSVHVGTFKTRSSIKKRFRVKPNGDITRLQSNRRHLNMAKSRKHVNRLGRMGVITAPGVRAKYLRILKVSPLKGRRREAVDDMSQIWDEDLFKMDKHLMN